MRILPLHPSRTPGAAATPGPIAATLAGLHAACFPDNPWTAQACTDLLAPPAGRGWVAVGTDEAHGAHGPDGTAVGLLLCHVAADVADVLTLAVLPHQRRTGVARRLLTHGMAALAQEGVTALHLEVATDNAAAIACYTAAGFILTGERRNYYAPTPARPTGAHALTMRRDLP